jgi:NhaA family Na+:H+ antiporter
MSAEARPTKLEPAIDLERDHVLGNPGAEMTVVEYGSYACTYCHAAHEVIAELRDRFGDRMRYIFRHRPLRGIADARRAAELAERAFEISGEFWPIHDALMKRGPKYTEEDFVEIAREFQIPLSVEGDGTAGKELEESAKTRIADDEKGANRSGVAETPTFFLNGRRYEGEWDENTLADAMLGRLGHRIHAATVDFVRWGPSAGLLLLLMSVLAVVLANSSLGAAFEGVWSAIWGIQAGGVGLMMPLLHWVNDGLLAVFFLVVGLEIKREFTVGRLATFRSAALPVIAALGGILAPIGFYLLCVPSGPWAVGWAVPISTDTAFAVAIIVLLGSRVPVELRVFLTAAVIIDDLVAIGVIAAFYTDSIHLLSLIASGVVTALLVALNRFGIYRPLPYVVLGVGLWVCLHDAGLHATLAGVILALATPARPPAKLHALLAQAEAALHADSRRRDSTVMRHGPSEPLLQTMDAIHRRIQSPTDKLLRTLEPWSSYVVLPVFALANAGVIISLGVMQTHGNLLLGVILGLVLGKPLGIVLAAWLAVRFGIAEKPPEYSWRQLWGAAALAGIGFTMSLFIAGEAFPNPNDFAAAKIAIFVASLIAGIAGTATLWRQPSSQDSSTETNPDGAVAASSDQPH